MKRSRVIGYAIAAVAVVTAIVVCVLGNEREPSHDGKTLTQWLVEMQGLGMNNRAKYNECSEAVYTMGTNAVPTLLRMVDCKDSPVKLKAIQWLGPQWSERLKMRRADYYHSKVTFGFSSLRERAAPAVPGLIALLHSSDRGVQAAAAECLSDIGPEAGPATEELVQLLHNCTRNDGILILSAMDGLRGPVRNVEIAVPELLIWINGERKSWNYVQHAVEVLYSYGPAAKAAVPALQSLLNDPDPNLSNAAFNSLWRIDRQAAEKFQKEKWEHDKASK